MFVFHGRSVCLCFMADLYVCVSWQVCMFVLHGRPVLLLHIAVWTVGITAESCAPV